MDNNLIYGGFNIIYGSFSDFILNNSFNPHDSGYSHALVELNGSFNKVLTQNSGFKAPSNIIAIEVIFKERKPLKLSDTKQTDIESMRLVRYNKYSGTYHYFDKGKNYINEEKIPYMAEWETHV